MEWCEHLTFGVIYSHPACGECPTQAELERHALNFLAHIKYRQQHPKRPGEEWYEFRKHYQEVAMSELEIQRLAAFLMTWYPQEIGAGNFKTGESAVDVAVRMIARMAAGIDQALCELGIPADDPVSQGARITEILLEAQGLRGRDQVTPITTLRGHPSGTPDQVGKQHIRFAPVYEGTLGSAKKKESPG